MGRVFEVGRTGKLAAAELVDAAGRVEVEVVEVVEVMELGELVAVEVGGSVEVSLVEVGLVEDRGAVAVEITDVVAMNVDVVVVGFVDAEAGGRGRGAGMVFVEVVLEEEANLVLVGAETVTVASTVVVAVPLIVPEEHTKVRNVYDPRSPGGRRLTTDANASVARHTASSTRAVRTAWIPWLTACDFLSAGLSVPTASHIARASIRNELACFAR